MNSLRTLRDPTTEFGRDSQPNMMSRKKSLQTTLESSAQPVNQLLSEISNKAACNQPFSKFSIQNSTLRNQLAPLTFETDLILKWVAQPLYFNSQHRQQKPVQTQGCT